MNQDLANQFEKYILGARSIVVCVHKSPDPDAVGSLVAMQKFYDNYFAKIHNAEIHYIIPDELPDHLQWMIEGERDKYLIDDDFQKGGKRIFNDADLVICMDLADSSRIAMYGPLFEKSDAIKVNIDHHPQICDDFDFVVRDMSVSSTSELLFTLLSLISVDSIDSCIANALYAGILGDTGSFSYSCDTPSTYYVVAELLTLGAEVEKIHELLFNNYPYERTQLLGYVLDKKLKLVKVNNEMVSYYSLSVKELEEYHYKPGYLENVINYALNIKGVKVAASFVQRNNNLIRISLRSKGKIRINEFACNYFNGGGHPNASGASVYDKSLEECVDIYLKNIPEVF